MFTQVTDENELARVIEILVPQREKCLYLFCNIMKYGIVNDNFKVFLDKKSENVIGVYFGDSVHILAKAGIDNSILDFIKVNKPRTIFSSESFTSCDQYNEQFTGVYKLRQPLINGQSIRGIKQLNVQDIENLTAFLYQHSEEYQKTYDREKLKKQLIERLETGYCRYFGKFKGAELIACAFTKAEIKDVMVVGGILVSPDNRGVGIAKELCVHKGTIAINENRMAYCFIDEMNYASIQLHKSVGYEKVDNIYKYTRRTQYV